MPTISKHTQMLLMCSERMHEKRTSVSLFEEERSKRQRKLNINNLEWNSTFTVNLFSSLFFQLPANKQNQGTEKLKRAERTGAKTLN